MSFRRQASRSQGTDPQRLGALAFATAASLLLHVVFLTAWKLHRADLATHQDRRTPPPPVVVENLPSDSLTTEAIPQLRRKDRLAESAPSADRRKPDENAFLGERNQRVERESRSRRVGRFAPGGPEGDRTEAPRERASADGPRELAMSDLLAVEDLESSPAAASDDALGDVAPGELTLLNTREYRFFSFYRRMKDALRSVWRREIQLRNASLVANGKLVAADEIITALRIELGPDGELRKADIVYSSGIETFDEAAVYAFRSVGRFPNPPAGMRNPDGVVTLRWEFVIYGNQGSGFRIARDRNAPTGRRLF